MKRITKAALLALLAPCYITIASQAFAAATSTNNANNGSNSVSPAERTKIETVVREYLIAKPEVLVEAMQVLQNRQVEQAKESISQTQKDAPRFAKPLFQTAGDPVGGNKDGKVTVVEFFDYQCPHCVEMSPVLDAVIKANPDVRVVYKDWPIRGPVSEFAARAAIAANKQGKYMEMHNALLNANQQLTQDLILSLAQKAGLDVERLKKDMADSSTDAQVKATIKLAQDLKLFGTPAFFVGKTNGTTATITYVPGQLNQAQMQEIIDKAAK